MKKSHYIKCALLLIGCALLSSGCIVRERRVYAAPPPGEVSVSGEVDVAGPPPAPLEDTVSIAPDPSFVWIGGIWVWGAGGWRWEGGHWARPPHPGAVWVPHRYVYRNGRHVWVRGGWR